MEVKLSSLGYLLKNMNIATSTLAKRLHVDSSLVSKWRSGNRQLNPKSTYFNEIIIFLLEQDENLIISALRPLNPLQSLSTKEDIQNVLQSFLANRRFIAPKVSNQSSELICTAEISLYNKSAGRREALSILLDQAESMTEPGELLFIDTEQGFWLLEDEEYAHIWVDRIVKLLDRGFHAKIALHFTVETARFSSFFRLCSPLIFHRNARWLCHQYFDDNIYWFSFFILEHTMSIMGMSMGKEPVTTTVFTDSYSIMQHKSVVEMVINSCTPMFQNYSPLDVNDMISSIHINSRTAETFYSFLPAPAFISVSEDILDEILKNNCMIHTSHSRCKKTNKELSNRMQNILNTPHNKFIQILQIEEMERRIKEGFISTSLSHVSGNTINVSRQQYANGLKSLINRLKLYPNYHIVFCTTEDKIHLPVMNCWCRGSSWLVEMDNEGFRVCDNATMVSAATVALEQGWRRIPPHRKDRNMVIDTLKRLIAELESQD